MMRSIMAGSVSLLAIGLVDGAAARDIEAELDALRALVEQQQDLIDRQSAIIEAQGTRLSSLEAQLAPTPTLIPVALSPSDQATVTVSPEGQTATVPVQAPTGTVVQAPEQGTPEGAPQPTGQPPTGQPPQPVELDVAAPANFRGVLTPPGTVIVEPSLEFEQTSTEVFFFNGVEVIETILVGDIEITDADRDTFISRVNIRTGITDRSEVELSIPYIYRDDTISSEVLTAGGGTTVDDLSGSGIGDVEVTGRYQINDGDLFWPTFIANLRFKTDTGTGPFDVDRNDAGVETELTTGSGFFAIQPSLSFLYPVDPAVFFGSASYTFNLPRDVDTTIGTTEIGRVNPGDVVGISFGVGYALNDRTSLSMSYEHSFIDSSVTETNGIDVRGESFDVGSLNFGGSLRITDYMRLNLGVRAGITEDAPDVAITARLPISFDLF